MTVFSPCRYFGVSLQCCSCPRRVCTLVGVCPHYYHGGLSNCHLHCVEAATEQGQACLQGSVFFYRRVFLYLFMVVFKNDTECDKCGVQLLESFIKRPIKGSDSIVVELLYCKCYKTQLTEQISISKQCNEEYLLFRLLLTLNRLHLCCVT